MPLSPSTIVLGLATAATLGYAVRDQVKNGKPNPFEEMKEEYNYRRSSETDREEMEERMAERRAEYEARENERREEQDKLERERTKQRREALEAAELQLEKDKARDVRELSKLFGAARATFGGALAGTRIGMSSTDFVPKLAEVSKVTDPLHAQDTLVDDAGDVVRSVTLRPGLGCNDLQDKLVATWGEGKPSGLRTVWTEDRTGMRVVLEKAGDRSCSFQFEQFAPVDRWLSSVVPTAMLGRPDVDLITDIKRRSTAYGMTANDTTITWTDLGVGLGRGTTTFRASLTKGKVTTIDASIDGGDDAITARLKALYGKPTDPDASMLTWSRPYFISWDGQSLTLSTQKPEE